MDKKTNQPTGFALGSIEGRVAIQYVQPTNPKDNFTFKCHRSNGTTNGMQDIYAVSFFKIYFILYIHKCHMVLNFLKVCFLYKIYIHTTCFCHSFHCFVELSKIGIIYEFVLLPRIKILL